MIYPLLKSLKWMPEYLHVIKSAFISRRGHTCDPNGRRLPLSRSRSGAGGGKYNTRTHYVTTNPVLVIGHSFEGE